MHEQELLDVVVPNRVSPQTDLLTESQVSSYGHATHDSKCPLDLVSRKSAVESQGLLYGKSIAVLDGKLHTLPVSNHSILQAAVGSQSPPTEEAISTAIATPAPTDSTAISQTISANSTPTSTSITTSIPTADASLIPTPIPPSFPTLDTKSSPLSSGTGLVHPSEVEAREPSGSDHNSNAKNDEQSSPIQTSTIFFPQPATKGEYEQWRYLSSRISTQTRCHLSQYLFRVTSDSSQGFNTPDHFKAGALLNQFQSSLNFYSLGKDHVRQSLLDHIRTRHTKSHWISFTSSIAFAISRALTLREKKHKNIRIWILDTFKIQGNPLIVHAYSMLEPYKVRLNQNLSYDITRTKTAWNEFLVWDEIRIKSSSISLNDLLRPSRPMINYAPPGLLVLMPNLVRKTKGGGFEAKSPAKLLRDLYGLDDRIRDREMERNQFKMSKDRVGRFGNIKCSMVEEEPDPRYDIDPRQIMNYKHLVSKLDPEFQLPMMAALLSMQADVVYKRSIIKEIANIAQKNTFQRDPMFENLRFWKTTLHANWKPELQTFEEIMAECCTRIAGRTSVIDGPENDTRVLSRLDADPMLSNTVTGALVDCPEFTAADRIEVQNAARSFANIHRQRREKKQEASRAGEVKNAAGSVDRSGLAIEATETAKSMPDSFSAVLAKLVVESTPTSQTTFEEIHKKRKRPLPIWATSATSKKRKLL